MTEVVFEDRRYALAPGQSVLDRLLEAGHALPYSCKAGACQTCLLQAEGPVPATAQAGLRETDKALGYFLPCICRPQQAVVASRPQQSQHRHVSTVLEKQALNAEVVRLRLSTPAGLRYRPGQYLTLWHSDNLGRSYSLASRPDDGYLELHIRRVPGGRLSNWLHDELQPGQALALSGPVGNCFYTPDQPEQPLLLLGTSTGLAPLYGILREALAQGHRGPIHLLHGALAAPSLYYQAELSALAATYPQLHYQAFALEGDGPRLDRRPIDQAALALSPDFAGWSSYLCGAPALVNDLRKKLFLAGASLHRIHADAFLLTPATS